MKKNKMSKSAFFVKKTGTRIGILLCLVVVLAMLGNANVLIISEIVNGFVVSAQTANEKSNTPAVADNTDRISSEALNQIEALEREKESRTSAQQKIDSNLLYQLKMERREAIADGVPTLETDLKVDENGFIGVDITAHVTARLLKRLDAIHAEIIAVVPEYRSITAKVPLSEIETLAAMDEIIFIQPKMEARTNQRKIISKDIQPLENALPPIMQGGASTDLNERSLNVRNYLSDALANEAARPAVGSATSEGDATHRAVNARAGFNTTGTGIKIGVLSDGVNTLAARQASGDLPAVTVLAGQAGSGDEGTAMLEIVHDVAPGAQLYFATAFTSITSFAANIKALRAAGCDIIIDDVSYYVETPFQDGQAATVISPSNAGVVVQAVNDVTVGSQAGALYFSSAANSGNKNDGTSGAWEGDFADGGATATPLTTGNRVHSFGATNYTVISAAAATGTPVNLKWSDPLGGSSNDYDLYELNAGGTSLTRSANNVQSGTQDPSEQLSGQTAGRRIVIVKKAAAASRFLHLNMNGGTLSVSTSGIVFGHNAGKNTVSVAATPSGPAIYSQVVGPYPNAYSASNLVEIFSSDGPRRIFYNANGTPITTGNVSATGGQLLQKPDITAADGVTTTTPGFIPFFGTSAAAPHAGALMALLKSAKPSATNTDLYTAMTGTAIDIEAAGTDRDSGFGIFMPVSALNALGAQKYAFLRQNAATTTDAPGNGNGRVEPGENATLNVQLENIGAATAIATSATLTTSTAGVTIVNPTRAYSNLASNAVGTSVAPWQFIVGNNFSCGGTINFTLTVSYTGGVNNSQTFDFTVNTQGYTNFFTENFDGVTAPALPSGWTTARTGTSPPALFATTTTTPDTAPNAVFTNGVGTVASNSLISPSIALPTGQSSFQLSFRQTRNFESGGYDGGILELSTNGGTTFNNVTSGAVGGAFTTGGYNCTIDNGYSNPLGGQNGWCNTQASYETTTLTLPGTLSGQTIQLRWRAGWDNLNGAANPNWRIDGVALAQPSSCAAFTASTITINSISPNPSSVGQNVTVTYSITSSVAESLMAPAITGDITVTDGVDSCTGTVAAGQCTLAFSTAGNRTLRAFYTGDANVAAAVSSGSSQQVLAPTAANVSISGRVITPQGLGLTNALVILTDMQGNSRTMFTGRGGRFMFTDVGAGATYILSVRSKRYIYAPQIITVNEDLTELSFAPQ